ncbi:MAG TPA: multicopper oxidase domain-containing protein [Candidatus Dormibacteraeota bacterium]|nr:multicopper oxidase domain-containing protein [Candidatus Dormibacteraeota bacterium]
MYFNVYGEKVSRKRYREMVEAGKNRRELIAAGLTSRRDLMKLGLLTAGGMLVAKSGLSARARGQSTVNGGVNQLCVPNQPASPPTRGFVQPLNVMRQAIPVPSLTPVPTIAPNPGAGESRTDPHQIIGGIPFPPPVLYNFTQKAFSHRFSPGLPPQTIWGFDDGHGVMSPGPTYAAQYGIGQLTRNHNALPPLSQNGGFGMPSVTTHLHNGHTASESDGNPLDFFEIGHFYDQHYPNVLAGFASTNEPNGDINESLSTLWYHDHRVDFTSQNTYKGLVGFYLLFNQFDTGNEETGFRLPSYPQFDIPLAFADKFFDDSGELAFDLFNLDGILGDKFLVNGTIQPFFQVQPRRYRFRLLDTGPSRFYSYFLTDPSNLSANNPFWVIANDGNLLPAPVQVSTVRIGPAERVDIIIDFSQFAGKSIFLENRLLQINGQGPVPPLGFTPGQVECSDTNGNVLSDIRPAGQGDLLLRFDVSSKPVKDNSLPPSKQTLYSLPSTNATPRITRTFKFDRLNGQWSVNGQFVDTDRSAFRFTVQQNSVENWLLTNLTGDWTHPIHIHLEEHQILSRNRMPNTLAAENSRKDVTQLHPNERVLLFFRFRDWLGRYPIHCHNVVHEDHAMMALWHVEPTGDNVFVP